MSRRAASMTQSRTSSEAGGTRMRQFVLAAVAAAAVPAPALRAAPAELVVFEVSAGASGPVVRQTSGSPAASPVPPSVLRTWVENAARSVSAYYGRTPGPARVVVLRGARGAVGQGVTRRGDVPTIRVALGPATTAADLETDWVLTHEMVHTAFPRRSSPSSGIRPPGRELHGSRRRQVHRVHCVAGPFGSPDTVTRAPATPSPGASCQVVRLSSGLRTRAPYRAPAGFTTISW